MSGPQSMGVMIAFSVAMVTGIWVTLVVCLRNDTGGPIAGLLLLLVAPFPLLLCCQPRGGAAMPAALQDGEDAHVSAGRRLGLFVFSTLVTAAYGSVLVMLRDYKLSPGWASWALVGMTLTGTMSFVVLRCSMQGGCR